MCFLNFVVQVEHGTSVGMTGVSPAAVPHRRSLVGNCRAVYSDEGGNDRGHTAMAANLTPQYLEAEAEYKQAQTAEERLACLKKMLTLVPKHKASEKLQAELKTKISDAREEDEHEKKAGKK